MNAVYIAYLMVTIYVVFVYPGILHLYLGKCNALASYNHNGKITKNTTKNVNVFFFRKQLGSGATTTELNCSEQLLSRGASYTRSTPVVNLCV